MEDRITRWKRTPERTDREPDLNDMARQIAARLEQTFGKELLQGPFLDQILQKAREMIADQVEESVGAALFEPELVVVEEDEDEEPPPFSDPIPESDLPGNEAHSQDYAEVVRRIQQRNCG